MNRPSGPVYTGVRTHIHETAGFSLRIPSDWTAFLMTEGHEGYMFGPYPDTLDTVLLAEKIDLPFAVHEKEVPLLRKGFIAGLQALPGLEIEQQDESLTRSAALFEARFTFTEGESRRKRWVRAIYMGETQFLLIAQGSTPDEFDYWLPMFYNIMHTSEFRQLS